MSEEREKSCTVMLACRNEAIAGWLRTALDPASFLVVEAAFGAQFLPAVRMHHPDVAIIDLALGHDAASMMISILKSMSHAARIVVLSFEPSRDDARVIEQGIFYYLADPEEGRLVEVVRAAARGRGI